MAKRKNRNSNMSIISAKKIVCQETAIQISDEKLKSALSKSYEEARKDANRFKIHKLYNVFLTISGTLFLSLITSDFKNLSFISSKVLEKIGWIVCALFFVMGIILLIRNGTVKHNKETEERDKAIQQVIKEIIKE